jgi:hypothetical protein
MSKVGWTNFQDTLLLQAYEKYSDKAFPGKTALECAARYKILSERGEASLSDYQSRNKLNTSSNRVKREFILNPSPFAPSNYIVISKFNCKGTITPMQSKITPLQSKIGTFVKTEPIEYFVDFPRN